ncbi:carotenoid oxygenase family protein [Baaleninema simplex]|uniref:carotenoid oxygenase family protein n=1 Tax=Baaleninema simplex TaxID=2862350 RepID=UPI00034555DE|nr:carotenoid oxygenase family protein [Baaleninema simplex]
MTHAKRFPKAVLSTSRAEFYDAPLELSIYDADGNPASIPEDLQGHVFIIGPVGSVDSICLDDDPTVVLPSGDGWTPLINGDGMVYRLDFHRTTTTHETGKAWLATRLVKPPSFYADELTRSPNSPYRALRFENLGVSRFSLTLGLCHQLNTAFVPVRFPGDDCQRLVVTHDASRPYELDPRSLKILAPIGKTRQWHPLNRRSLPSVFRPVMGSAHPTFDPNTGEFFTANIQKSLSTMLYAPRLFPQMQPTPAGGEEDDLFQQWVARPVQSLWERWQSSQREVPIVDDDGLYLMRWTGNNTVESWKLVLEDGSPAKIRQSCHQMGVTRRYVVLVDTAFKLALENILPNSLPEFARQFWESLDRTPAASLGQMIKEYSETWIAGLRERLTYPQSPNTDVYLVERDQLRQVPSGETIVARKVTVDGAFTHYLTDYDDSDGAIVLHAGMNYSTDPAEFTHRQDRSIFNDPELNEALKSLPGMMAGGLDINAPAAIAIDLETRTIRKCELNLNDSISQTFYIGLYAFCDESPSKRIEEIYWTGGGAWTELMTDLACGLYANDPARRMATEEVLECVRSEQYAPVVLSRFRIDRAKLFDPSVSSHDVMTVADSYKFEPKYYPNSPQFVPRPNASCTSDGYIVCNVIYSDRLRSQNNDTASQNKSDNSELWVFDAGDLRKGPLLKLSHPHLNFGLTIHTTWLKRLPDTNLTRPDYNIAEDFDELVSQVTDAYSSNLLFWFLTQGKGTQIAQKIRDLLDEIYQQFNG